MRHRLADAERIADRQHHVADLQRVGVGEVERRKTLLRALDAQHRKIAALVLENNIGVEFALVGQRDFHFAGAFDHVIIGDDQTRGVDQHSGAERALDLFARHAAAKKLAEERIGHERIVVLDDMAGIDVDHRRRDAFDHRRKRQFKLAHRTGHLPILRTGSRHERGGDDGQSGENGWEKRAQHCGNIPIQ